MNSKSRIPRAAESTTERGVGSDELIEVTIGRIVPGGFGMVRLEGRTLFVALAAEEDRARVRITRTRGRTAFGEIAELLEPSDQRAEPVCPYFGRCGGCDFQHLRYAAQLTAKIGIVEDCLRRIAGIAEPKIIDITPSPEQVAHRSRAEWQISPDGNSIGYFARDSHDIVDVEACPVLVPALANALARVRERAKRGGRGTDSPKQLQASTANDKISVTPDYGGLRDATLEVEIAGERYQYGADCFFQANLGVLPSMIAEALRFAAEAHEDSRRTNEESGGIAKSTAVDLYSGVGLFTIPLARCFDRVSAVELHAVASTFAASNVASAGLQNVRLTSMPVERWLMTRGRTLKHVGLTIVDPPRSGLGKQVVDGTLHMRPERISYVSCDPATLARDLKGFLAGGYELERVAAFDMFPQTHHVEIIAHLKRGR